MTYEVDMKFNTGETDEELRNKYDPEGSTLRRSQLRMLEMLKFTDKVCKENGIEYFVFYGTLLGAVRHQGFIPWDDDLDIFMSVKDSDKFASIVNAMSDCDFVVQNHDIDPGCVRMWNVIRDKKSEYKIDNPIHTIKKYRGLQIDIFTYDTKTIEFGRRLIRSFTAFNENHLVVSHPKMSGIWYAFTKKCLIPFFKFLCRFKKEDDRIYMAFESFYSEQFEKDDIFPVGEVLFEGERFSAPKDAETCVRKYYGEGYMNLPSPSERNHHNVDNIVFYD